MDSWSRYEKYLCAPEGLELTVDPSLMGLDDAFLEARRGDLERAFRDMRELEGGELANEDERRMVGHYWLREASLAPAEYREQIRETVEDILTFAGGVLKGDIAPPRAPRYENVLLIGIGGSALGPQLASDALVPAGAGSRLRSFFMDNTDPDGMERCLESIRETGGGLAATLVVVVSKSGGTKETRNGMLLAEHALQREGLPFRSQAVAITLQDPKSALYRIAAEAGAPWLKVFRIWDWVGGRTSQTSAVGLLPAALEGIDVRSMLEGARAMDAATRVEDPLQNPAALLALCWHRAGNGRGEKAMVILPYKDRLLLLSRYLQQLVMESLGKNLTRRPEPIATEQGITVYGNKGSTDQHAFVQQLRDGLSDFFVTFVQVLEDGGESGFEVEEGITCGDYLLGFLLGTRRALRDKERPSLTITIPRVDAGNLGKLIALFERAVGFYASFVDINAYHQPGVEAGKLAAAEVLRVQLRVMRDLEARRGDFRTAPAIAASVRETLAADVRRAKEAGTEEPDRDLNVDTETVYHILVHRSANGLGGVQRREGERPTGARFGVS